MLAKRDIQFPLLQKCSLCYTLGMDYDWLTDTLYWSEQSVDKIFLWNVTNGRILSPGEITATGLGFPKALKVDPFKK